MRNQTPKISVVMSVYNRAQYSQIAINSILNQTFANFELIIFDNGSTDNTTDIIKDLAQKDDRIILIKNTRNINYTQNLIRGFEMAKGEYIARMDDDDISLPDRFAKQIEFLDKHKEITVLGTFINTFGDNKIEPWINLTRPEEIEVAINFFNPICHSSVMIRKEFLIQHNLQYKAEELYAEDYQLWGDIILHGGKIANLPIPLLNYRCHAKSATQSAKFCKIQNISAEKTRYKMLKRFFKSKSATKQAMKKVFKYPFEKNNKRTISTILERMKKYPKIISSTGISLFEKKFLGVPIVMDIFFASGNDFACHLCVAITSILQNALPFENFRFYILDGGISKINKDKINKCQKIKNCEIEFIEIDNSKFKNCPITPEGSHMTKQTYYRYLIPQLKPELNKCFYFDCDIVVTDSLNAFWNIDLGENYIAAVEEFYEDAEKDTKRLKTTNIFNAGILLINLKKWKNDHITNLLFQNTEKLTKSGLLKWLDQDVMNYTFNNQIKFVPPEFNLQGKAFYNGQSSQYTKSEMEAAKHFPVIIHYNSYSKPWHKNCTHPLKKYYYKYLKISPFKERYLPFFYQKLFKEFCNIFYRKKHYNNGNLIVSKILGIPILKTKFNNFYKKKYLFGIKISHKFLTNDFLNYKFEELAEIKKQVKCLQNKIVIPDKRVEKYKILKENYDLIERINTSDKDVFYQIFVDENYKYEINFEPKIILDFGANVGYSAIYFATKYPNAKIYCLEADFENFKTLIANTRKFPNISCIHGALYSKNCALNVIDNNLGEWGFSVNEKIDQSREITQGYSFETLLDIWKLNQANLDIVKIDIEGSEKEVFDTNCDWLGRTKLLFIETHDRFKENCAKTVLKKLLEYHFTMDIRGDNMIFTNLEQDTSDITELALTMK